MKQDDFLHVVLVCGPNGEGPKEQYTIKQFSEDLEDLDNSNFEVLQGNNVGKVLVKFCKEKDAHFFLCGSDEMENWLEKKEMLGSISDSCVEDSECFVITTQLNVFEKEDGSSTRWRPDKFDE